MESYSASALMKYSPEINPVLPNAYQLKLLSGSLNRNIHIQYAERCSNEELNPLPVET